MMCLRRVSGKGLFNLRFGRPVMPKLITTLVTFLVFSLIVPPGGRAARLTPRRWFSKVVCRAWVCGCAGASFWGVTSVEGDGTATGDVVVGVLSQRWPYYFCFYLSFSFYSSFSSCLGCFVLRPFPTIRSPNRGGASSHPIHGRSSPCSRQTGFRCASRGCARTRSTYPRYATKYGRKGFYVSYYSRSVYQGG